MENRDVAPKNESDCRRVSFILIGILHVLAILMPPDYLTVNSGRATKVVTDLGLFQSKLNFYHQNDQLAFYYRGQKSLLKNSLFEL